MSILHTFTITKPYSTIVGLSPLVLLHNNFKDIPDSLNAVYTNTDTVDTIKITFVDQTALISFITATKLTTDEISQLAEWKTAYNISYTVTIEQLSDTEPTITTSYDWPYAVWPTGNWPN